MKKLLCVLLVLVMVFALSTVAFADSAENMSPDDPEKSSQIVPVTTNVQSNIADTASIVYSVKIEWDVTPGTVAFEGGRTYTWSPQDRAYIASDAIANVKYKPDADNPVGTESTNVKIRVTNNSNADVQAYVAPDTSMVEGRYDVAFYLNEDQCKGFETGSFDGTRGEILVTLERADTNLSGGATVSEPDENGKITITGAPEGSDPIGAGTDAPPPTFTIGIDVHARSFSNTLTAIPFVNNCICNYKVMLRAPNI